MIGHYLSRNNEMCYSTDELNNINCIANMSLKLASRTADSWPSEVHDGFKNLYPTLHFQSKGRRTE